LLWCSSNHTCHVVRLLPCYVSQFLFFFFLLIPPPPISTLFPYTTLFRSKIADVRVVYATPDQEAAAPGEPMQLVVTFEAPRGRRDRKSTRLNSSHLVISYAVFCLKKKKNNNNKHIH